MKTVQIYAKSYNDVASVLVSGDEGQVYFTGYEKSEQMAIRRGASYVKNMLPYRELVEIFTDKLKSEEIFKDNYLRRLRLPISMGNELSENKALSQQCLNNLNVELRFNNLRIMERINGGR